ncbi:TetR/AcrR family transcriptional regulator [Lysinibacillus antri]|uniref:TetR family transcriptional regulator n=1 Tax=Lysinibacillus antri TaxID=2498145 RepID=A0A3S0PPE9_9BACI|nr:TetR family transcriptional regulator C-terminal domain-containing protein [Lysinibacillus antri]RUL52035.1 TetR family transcriptional regulator [Lysinibacillus antri]
MPKIVNHEERKALIAKATWSVIAREGLGGASVRSIAKEANLSLGAVRHYFNTQEELLEFAMKLVEEQVTERIIEHTKQPLPPKQLTLNMLMELVPVGERIVEMQVWLEYVSYKLRKKNLQEDAVHDGIVFIINQLNDAGLLKKGLNLEEEIIRLHALIDGLALHLLMGVVPIDADKIEALIKRELDRIFLEG